MTRPFTMDELYIACEHLNFDWMKADKNEFIRLWEEEYEFHKIAKFLKRSPQECLLLYIDLTDKNQIKPRKYGIDNERLQESEPGA